MARTDWTSKDTVRPEDMNQIGQEINDLESSVTVWLGVTEGTDTGYTVTSNKVSSLYESLRVSFRAHQTSGINPTLQINSLGAIPLKKPNGRAAKLDTDGVYTAVYSAASFILQGEGGEYGTAGAAQVRAPYTIGTENGIVTGTMQYINQQGISGTWENPSGGTGITAKVYGVLPEGYYDQATELDVYVQEPNLVSKNIAGGKSIFNVPGDPNVANTSDGNATASQILWNQIAYVKGQRIMGQMLNNTIDVLGNSSFRDAASFRAQTGTLFVAPFAGYYDTRVDAGGYGKLRISEPNLRPENIAAGKTMFGMNGTMGAVKNITRGQGIIGPGGVTLRINMTLDLNSVVLYFAASSIDGKPRSTKVRGKIDADGLYFDLSAAATQQVVVRYQLVEYANVKQIIRGDAIRETGTNAHIITLPSAVQMSRTFMNGSYNTDAPDDWQFGQVTPWVMPYLSYANQIQLMGSSVIKPNTVTKEWWSYQVVEFY